jgi:hypothetical protein
MTAWGYRRYQVLVEDVRHDVLRVHFVLDTAPAIACAAAHCAAMVRSAAPPSSRPRKSLGRPARC